ncbi:MAG: DNA-3-methyladenine glycosylase I [Pseudomonadota bacterium]
MTPFSELFQTACARVGSVSAVEARLEHPLTHHELRATPDHVWLSDMARRVFEATHGVEAVAARWEEFERALDGFDPLRCAELTDAALDQLAQDPRLIDDPDGLRAARANAAFLHALVDETGEAAAHTFANWPSHDFIGLLEFLSQRGTGLGGLTGQRLLRGRGVDGFILAEPVVRSLIREGVVETAPASRAEMTAVQTAFDVWRAESGRPMMHISKILALTDAPETV